MSSLCMIQLQHIPRLSIIWMDTEGADRVRYYHCDGMYSYCEGIDDPNDGKVLNLSRFTPLVKVGDHYEISHESDV